MGKGKKGTEKTIELTMKNNWRAGVSHTDKTELVTDGIYQISRNPAFLTAIFGTEYSKYQESVHRYFGKVRPKHLSQNIH